MKKQAKKSKHWKIASWASKSSGDLSFACMTNYSRPEMTPSAAAVVRCIGRSMGGRVERGAFGRHWSSEEGEREGEEEEREGGYNTHAATKISD